MSTPQTTAVDVHAHAMPLPALQWLAERHLADLSEMDRRVVRIDPAISGVGPGAPLPLPPSMHDPAVRLAEMDAVGVSHHAVSAPPFLFASNATDGALVADVMRASNDGLRQYCDADADRLLALGSVPLGWPGAAEEARRCLDDLGMAGLTIGSRGGGHDLDHAVNTELWELLSERETFVFLHPSGVPDPPRMKDFWFPQLLGYPLETTIAVARLAFAGVLERTPLRLCLAHGGGCLCAATPRLDLGWERKEVARTTAEPPSAAFAGLYYDTAVFSPKLLARLVEDVGAGQVLLGTDYPFDLAERDPLGFVRSAGFSPEVTETILFRTAQRLLRL